VYVIGIDTSAKTGSVALCDGDALLAELTLEMERSHSERLMPALDEILRLVGWDLQEVGLMTVALGPGSFTGLRVGVTTAKSLAFGLGIPAVGVSTFDAIAHRHRFRDGNLCILLDARKQEVYAAHYASDGQGAMRPLRSFQCVPVEKAIEGVRTPTLFVGDGVEAYRRTIEETLGENARFGDMEAGICRASAVAWVGAGQFAAHPTTPEDALNLAPLYIRRPEAEVHLRG
jgi:tRNA threonylcarbamoyladenosine biosynthesis protein TsaB